MSINENNQLEKSFKLNKPTIGVCYYPEHWPEDLWENDLERMLDHGIEVIRIFTYYFIL